MRRRWTGRTWILLAAALLAVAVLAGGGSWVAYTRSPAYSLGMLERAAAHKDWDGVQKYMDLDAVASRWLEVVTQAPRSAAEASGRPLVASALAAGQVRDYEAGLRKDVQRGIGPDATLVGPLKFGDLSRVKAVTYNGDSAIVTIGLPRPDGTAFDLRLVLEQSGDHWRLVGIDNAREASAFSGS